ncbi:hypothetical protein ONS95_012374 [Cadophora gregata]|uniref:uncharacterized protein n=1 Tax=Cadophora gregata TaxID=51156 RepID=UPI0026DCAE4C|nr:uncharacterized protein ONS95_012374 [Cadophora gregata]KAK0118065.1 hypothetical protein ONS95_012374 [Cadophora gregata]KAK0123134.1 hypothetical protein ONS96_010138 [Cadophora gregata f. sp. sojae]
MTSTFPLTLLGSLKAGFGMGLILAPAWTTSSLYYRNLDPASTNLAVRMVGARELLFGALLLGAKTHETRRAAVMASAAVDALDLAATIWGWERGQVENSTAGVFSAAATASVLLAGLVWKKAGLGAIKSLKM